MKGRVKMCVPPTAAIDVVKATYNAGKKALEIADNLKHVELKEAILELKEENLLLRERVLFLEEKLKEKQQFNMKFENNQYWNYREDGTKEGPFCVTCWDYNKTASRLIDGYYCGICVTKRGRK